ncbi:hypothetical protein PAXINDRAFT_19747 [Paxillus involutus ATCC 200175]|uniref:Uncharacterized protein n=1 Tax=Paxillus involutus ATCC 200175 TaxID=664439 RepID=A0A0C9TIC3_PAXIN|nr:hypothetical protein PAXINDRAFT_19747 [Paxillus involutus ATCC 200175]
MYILRPDLSRCRPADIGMVGSGSSVLLREDHPNANATSTQTINTLNDEDLVSLLKLQLNWTTSNSDLPFETLSSLFAVVYQSKRQLFPSSIRFLPMIYRFLPMTSFPYNSALACTTWQSKCNISRTTIAIDSDCVVSASGPPSAGLHIEQSEVYRGVLHRENYNVINLKVAFTDKLVHQATCDLIKEVGNPKVYDMLFDGVYSITPEHATAFYNHSN